MSTSFHELLETSNQLLNSTITSRMVGSRSQMLKAVRLHKQL